MEGYFEDVHNPRDDAVHIHLKGQRLEESFVKMPLPMYCDVKSGCFVVYKRFGNFNAKQVSQTTGELGDWGTTKKKQLEDMFNTSGREWIFFFLLSKTPEMFCRIKKFSQRSLITRRNAY